MPTAENKKEKGLQPTLKRLNDHTVVQTHQLCRNSRSGVSHWLRSLSANSTNTFWGEETFWEASISNQATGSNLSHRRPKPTARRSNPAAASASTVVETRWGWMFLMTDEGRNVKNRMAVGGGDGDGGTLHVHSCFSFELQGSVSFFFFFQPSPKMSFTVQKNHQDCEKIWPRWSTSFNNRWRRRRRREHHKSINL